MNSLLILCADAPSSALLISESLESNCTLPSCIVCAKAHHPISMILDCLWISLSQQRNFQHGNSIGIVSLFHVTLVVEDGMLERCLLSLSGVGDSCFCETSKEWSCATNMNYINPRKSPGRAESKVQDCRQTREFNPDGAQS